MSQDQSDGITETIEDLLRVALLLGVRLAERHTRAREAGLRDAARQSLAHAEQERQQQLRHRDRALARLEAVNSTSWWEHASAQDIRQAWTSARTYQAHEPRAARATWTIADQLRCRYGLDVLDIDPEAFGHQRQLPAHTTISDRELYAYDRHLRRDAAELRGNAGASGLGEHELDARLAEIAELRQLIADELADRAQPQHTRRRDARELLDTRLAVGSLDDQPAYDTAARRQLLTQQLHQLGGDTETIQAIVLADTAQAHPPQMATHPTATAPATPASSRPRRTLRQRRPRGRA